MKELIANGTIGDVKLVQAIMGLQPSEKIDRLHNPALGNIYLF